MTRHFFIFALPRSRTAWLANWLTTDQSVCFHEFGATVGGGLWETVQATDLLYVGLSEPGLDGLRYIPPQFLESSPVAVITQPVAQSYQRCLQAWPEVFADDGTAEALHTVLCDWHSALERLHTMPNALSIPEYALGDLDVLEGLWGHLVGGIEHNPIRTRLLLEMDITVRYNTVSQGHAMTERHKEIAKNIRDGGVRS